jgi:phosphoenolpyruvate-protein phosphotransferase (PTS system enzyme I)
LTEHPSELVSRRWTGLPVSGGLAHGVVHVLKEQFDEPEPETIRPEQADHEMERLRKALAVTRGEIEELQRQMIEDGGGAEADIFDAHLLILDDESLLKQVERRVRAEWLSVDYAYYQLMLKNINALRRMSDPYLRERFLDIKDVTQRVMRHLRGEMLETPMFEHPVIVVAKDLTPSDTVQLDRSRVLGFAVETGSAVSHAAIIARSMDVPAVVRLAGISEELHSGDRVLLDGDEGVLILNPSEATVDESRVREAAAEQREDVLHGRRQEPARTLDGESVLVGVNGEFLEELPALKDSGAEEVGLFRTEFLHLADPEASEDWLAAAYRQVIESMEPRLVIFRTLDLGGDKVEEGYGLEPEPNPFLGWRGIRLSLGRTDLFKRQLRALLRAGEGTRVGIMFPMVTTVQELRVAKGLLRECAAELEKEGVAAPAQLMVGAMIEVPGAALMAEAMARQVDFLSLGTNDLVQYTLAVDRLNDRVSELYQTTHPAVLELIALTVRAGGGQTVRVGMCGEMAADISLTPLLLGMGLRELSVSTSQVARLKEAVRRLRADECRGLWETARGMDDAAEIRRLSLEMAESRYPDLFERSRHEEKGPQADA